MHLDSNDYLNPDHLPIQLKQLSLQTAIKSARTAPCLGYLRYLNRTICSRYWNNEINVRNNCTLIPDLEYLNIVECFAIETNVCETYIPICRPTFNLDVRV